MVMYYFKPLNNLLTILVEMWYTYFNRFRALGFKASIYWLKMDYQEFNPSFPAIR
jgi:hypothetical protein